MRHILTVDQFTPQILEMIIQKSEYHRLKMCQRIISNIPPAHGKLLTNLFYEPSTRTSSSFYSAMIKLGGHVIPINDVTFSSVVKGETLEDTIRTLECYSDVIVLRHKEVGAAQRAAAVSSVPIINAGDGVGEHPTQALLDFYTILSERGWANSGGISKRKPIEDFINENLTVTLMGDLKHGRTVKSLAKLLRMYNVKINWVSPEELKIPEEFLYPTDSQHTNLNKVIKDTDVLYVVRTQFERFVNEGFKLDTISYNVTEKHMAKAKSNMVLMHPLPRTEELPTSLDSDPRSAYFRQMKYGLYIRMALLDMILNIR